MSSPSSSDDAAAPETSGRRQEGSSQQQFVPVPVPVPVHVPMVPCQWPVPQHAMAAEHRLACRHAIEKQILFYFSAENMSRDSFLRSNMDEEGYVSLGKY
jgi:la-related protein 1